jgi:hypothetical protein
MTVQRKRARKGRRKSESYDGPYWIGGLMSQRWAERHSRPDWPDELARLLAHARAHVNRPLGAEYLAQLEREWAQLEARRKGET